LGVDEFDFIGVFVVDVVVQMHIIGIAGAHYCSVIIKGPNEILLNIIDVLRMNIMMGIVMMISMYVRIFMEFVMNLQTLFFAEVDDQNYDQNCKEYFMHSVYCNSQNIF
jgi:hypothetical protein